MIVAKKDGSTKNLDMFHHFQEDDTTDTTDTTTTQECFIPQYGVNNRVCDCPGCEDEDGGDAKGGVPVPPLEPESPKGQQRLDGRF